ncbi:MAG: PIN domain-containing protein [Ferruginibacter sp.]
MENVFVDTDIILDLLSNREPFYIHAAKLFSAADKNEIKIYVPALAFTNLNYILSKQYSADQAKKKLLKFKTLVIVFAVTDKIIELALASDFKDFEDAVQYFIAIENNIKILLTRNLKDYKSSEIPVMTAEQFLKIQTLTN